MTAARVAVLAASLTVTGACGGDDDAGASDAASASESGTDAPVVPDASCVRPGDEGDERGIGRFCSPGGGQCRGAAPLCLAELAPAEQQWFCTRLCTDDTQCGSMARCTGDARGRACVPLRCLSDDADAGPMPDASHDATGADADADLAEASVFDGGG
ncbi:MAG: hypothetical protein NZ898_16600 [Myxococcota bacterium]|nr:hypothetical protein [Myxococcota bacterium]MDW8361557.1 hypothetical protein [Myxococcales bacterium]